MDKIHTLKVDSMSSIRHVVAMLQYELQIANKQGREIVIEIWKEKPDETNPRKEVVLSQLHGELAKEMNQS